MIHDYSTLLAVGICAFFLSNFIVRVAPGRGVGYLSPKGIDLDFPSWRASYMGVRVICIGPWRLGQPTVQVDMFAPSASGGVGQAVVAAEAFADATAWPIMFLQVVVLLLVIAMPVGLLLRGAGGHFLLLAAMAYLAYLVCIVAYLKLGDAASRQHARAHRGLLFEPLLCLPFAGKVPRKLYDALVPALPLIDLLASEIAIDSVVLARLDARLAEMLDAAEAEDLKNHLGILRNAVAQRMPEEVVE
ncbi:MAG: hypothetical protein JO142_08240 [Burkholderiales bacterium]|nr:hypothetical protein [Burkholderiales bacterium]